MNFTDPDFSAIHPFLGRMARFIEGNHTWAEVEGWSASRVYGFADLGYRLLTAGNLTAARVVFEGCYALNHLDWYFPYSLAHAHRLLKEPETALSYAEQACLLAPQRPEVLLVLGMCLVETGNPERALENLEKARVAATRTQPDNHGLHQVIGVLLSEIHKK